MTDEELDAIEARLWLRAEQDAIACCDGDIAALLAEVRRLREAVRKGRADLDNATLDDGGDHPSAHEVDRIADSLRRALGD